MRTLYVCGAKYTRGTCKQMVKGLIFPFAKGTSNIKVIFLFEVNYDIKHSRSGFEYDHNQIWLKFLYVLMQMACLSIVDTVYPESIKRFFPDRHCPQMLSIVLLAFFSHFHP